jgi:multicomponent Na+:H+ antiporter subunit D
MLTLFSMTKIWAEAFWKESIRSQRTHDVPARMRWSTVALASLSLALGLFAEPLMGLAQQAAEQLLDRKAYITAVLGEV